MSSTIQASLPSSSAAATLAPTSAFDPIRLERPGHSIAATISGTNPAAVPLPVALGAALWVAAEDAPVADGHSLITMPTRVGPDLAAAGAVYYLASGLDGFPCLQFAGGGERIQSFSPALNLGDNFTVALVMRTLEGNGDGMAWMFGNIAGQRRRSLWAQQRVSANFSGYDANVVSGAPTDQRCIITITRSGTLVTVRKNGTLVASGSPSLAPYSYEGFTIGANTGGTEAWRGQMAELVAFNRALTDAESVQLSDLWRDQYEVA